MKNILQPEHGSLGPALPWVICIAAYGRKGFKNPKKAKIIHQQKSEKQVFVKKTGFTKWYTSTNSLPFERAQGPIIHHGHPETTNLSPLKKN
jgi:hypothetical protein